MCVGVCTSAVQCLEESGSYSCFTSAIHKKASNLTAEIGCSGTNKGGSGTYQIVLIHLVFCFLASSLIAK